MSRLKGERAAAPRRRHSSTKTLQTRRNVMTLRQSHFQHQALKFLSLPPGLRNAIYEYAFAESMTAVSVNRGRYTLWHTTSNGIHRFGLPALLYASKQLRQEATGTFWSTTRIVGSEAQHLKQWLTKVDIKLRRQIKCVHLEASLHNEDYQPEQRSRLEQEGRLRYLKAMLRMPDLDMPDCDVELRIVRRETGVVLWPREDREHRAVQTVNLSYGSDWDVREVESYQEAKTLRLRTLGSRDLTSSL